MKKHFITLILIVSIFSFSIACVCRWWNDDLPITYLSKSKDLFIKGHVVDIVSCSPYSKDCSRGRHVLIEVDSLFSESEVVVGDTILIIQDVGNCQYVFSKNEYIIFFANQVNFLLPAKREFSFEYKDTFKVFVLDKNYEPVDLIKNCSKKYKTYTTNMCLVVNQKSPK